MYARFFRWASDRIDENGIIVFVTNSSFVHRYTFDGFRKCVAEDFSDIYILDLGGDVRSDPRLSGTRNNVFGIQTGVAISFMVKRQKAKGCRVRYARRPQLETAEEKIASVANTNISGIELLEISPNSRNGWLDEDNREFEQLLPVADRGTKSVRVTEQERAIFKLVPPSEFPQIATIGYTTLIVTSSNARCDT